MCNLVNTGNFAEVEGFSSTLVELRINVQSYVAALPLMEARINFNKLNRERNMTREDLKQKFLREMPDRIIEGDKGGYTAFLESEIMRLTANNSIANEDKKPQDSCHIGNVIHWVALSDKRPDTEWGDLLVCLENEAIFIANYSRIANERWLIAGVGEIKELNPVVFWAKLPEPPCV